MVDEEAFKAWIRDCQNKLGMLSKVPFLDGVQYSAIADKLLTPWYHFHADYMERRMLEKSGRDHAGKDGRESGVSGLPLTSESQTERSPVPSAAAIPSSPATAQESGKPAEAKCAKCGNDFIPKVKGARLCFNCWKKEHPRK